MTAVTKIPARERPLTARQILSTDVITVQPNLTLRAAAATLRDNRITGAAVVTASGKLIGVLSETDLVDHESQPRVRTYVVHGAQPENPSKDVEVLEASLERDENATVADVFSPYVITAGLETTVNALSALMVRHRVHRVFIVDGPRLAGVVSSMDVMKAVSIVRVRKTATKGR